MKFFNSELGNNEETSNIGKLWSVDENNELYKEVENNKNYSQIAAIHKRTEKAIILRVISHIIYPKYPKLFTSWYDLGKEGRQEWHDALDALEHAYDMFCEKTKITNAEMRVTDTDVKDHLSRMWEVLDTETQNTWIVSAGETLPVRQRRVRGLFEDSDSDED